MALVCFASFKGSPGATLTALATAAAWPTGPGRRKLLLEADADGGVLALRYQLPPKPGLLSLTAAARRGLSGDQLWDHAQRLPGGLPVILGPDGPHQATEVLRAGGRDLGRWLSTLPDVDVIADVGRLTIGSAAFELAATADCVLGVVRPVAPQLVPAAQRLAALANYGLRVGWVLIGDKPYSAAEVHQAYGIPVIHVVEHDRRGAEQMEAGTNPAKLRRSSLVRSIASLTDTLAGFLRATAGPPAAPPSPPGTHQQLVGLPAPAPHQPSPEFPPPTGPGHLDAPPPAPDQIRYPAAGSFPAPVPVAAPSPFPDSSLAPVPVTALSPFPDSSLAPVPVTALSPFPDSSPALVPALADATRPLVRRVPPTPPEAAPATPPLVRRVPPPPPEAAPAAPSLAILAAQRRRAVDLAAGNGRSLTPDGHAESHPESDGSGR